MNNVIRLTVLPATRRSKELLVVSYKPGVPPEQVAAVIRGIEAVAQRRGADWLIGWDMAVTPPTSLYAAFRAWRQGKAREKAFRAEVARRGDGKRAP